MAALGEDLLGIVNKLQDLVFNTIGNDSLDLPQIVSNFEPHIQFPFDSHNAYTESRLSLDHNPPENPQFWRISLVEISCLGVAAS
jgi:hypothetical protein